MGTDDLFKKRRIERKKRSHDFRIPKANSYLIVTEGTKTEPLYFNGLKKRILESIGGTVDVVEIPQIDIHGGGRSTEKIVEITEEYVSSAKVIYQNIWLIFDKDDFLDFDSAIDLAKSKGYSVGWSNQSFEYWLFLHFEYSDSDLHRSQWNEKLSELFIKNNLSTSGYKKNLDNLYELLESIDGIKTAIGNATRRMADYRDGIDKPSEICPGTTVHELVEELYDYIEEESY